MRQHAALAVDVPHGRHHHVHGGFSCHAVVDHAHAGHGVAAAHNAAALVGVNDLGLRGAGVLGKSGMESVQ